MKITVLVVEDELAILERIVTSLRGAGHEAIGAISAELAQERLEQYTPDLVLTNWGLPGMSGLEFLRRLRIERQTELLPVMMLTARTDERDKLMAFVAGADDYMTKPFSVRELVARVIAVARRCESNKRDERLVCGQLHLETGTRVLSTDSASVCLRPAELKLLRYFMGNRDRDISRAQLLRGVWGSDIAVDQRTIDVHIRRLRVALERLDCGELLQTVRGFGYRFTEMLSA